LFSKGKIDLQLSKIELLNLFNTIDSNKNGIISTDEFIEWFNKFTKPSQKELEQKEQRKHVLSEVTNLISNYNLVFEKSNKINPEAESNYRKFINEINMEEGDYFKGIKSILKDPFKALKVAQMKADHVIKQRAMAQKAGEDYKSIFFVDEDFCLTTNTRTSETDERKRADAPADYEGKQCLLFMDMAPQHVCSDAAHWKNVQWLRPYEIVHKRGVLSEESNGKPEELLPTFFAQKVETKDVNQGLLGDCWFLAALSVVALKAEYLRGNLGKTAAELEKELTDAEVLELLKGVYPPIFHFLRDFGIYVFSFYKDCEWLYVIIDDFLPCDSEGELLFASCKQSNRFWASLIEKAYAKLHSNYHNLINGHPEEAMNDLTSLPSKRYRFREPGTSPDSKPLCFASKEEMWAALKNFYLEGHLMACGAEKAKDAKLTSLNGIIPGHAYTILEVYEFNVGYLNLGLQEI
jgi:hypothetical protein